MIFFLRPAPSGGAVHVTFGLLPGQKPLLIATPTPAIPANPLSATLRVLVNASTTTAPSHNPFVAVERPQREYRAVVDTDKRLRSSAMTYHFYTITAPSTTPVRVGSLTVNASAPTANATVPVVRDFMRGRLEYHLERIVASGDVAPKDGVIPILERSSLTRDDPVPCVLLKESWSPDTSDSTIGDRAGEWKDPGTGEAWREYHRSYRVRLDLLILSTIPDERTILATRLHEALEMDYLLLETAFGYRVTPPSRFTNDGTDQDGQLIYGEEINLDGMVSVKSRERLLYTLNANEVRFTAPL